MAATHQHHLSGSEFSVYIHGHEIWAAMEAANTEVHFAPGRLRLVGDVDDLRGQQQHVYFVTSLLTLASDEPMLKRLRQLHAGYTRFLVFSQNVGPESISEITAALDVRKPERIHTPRLEIDDLRSFCRRFLGSLSSTATHRSILDVWWEGARFVVKSAAFETLKIPVTALPRKLQEATSEERREIEIDEDGDLVYWPKFDIHMGWCQFQQAVDPASVVRAQQENEAFNKAYGIAIKGFREEEDLSQSDIDGLDARTIRRIEQGEVRASAKSLERLAVAHQMTTTDYMNEIAARLPKSIT